MLKKLYIKNVALISELEIEFCEKLNILSGETGAGKSIIVDSISFLLGTKADKTLIRSGESGATVWGEFCLNTEQTKTLLDNDFGYLIEDDTLIINRTINLNGKNECRVNSNLVTATELKRLTALLVDLHGQHAHQSLLSLENHIKILDGYINDREFDEALIKGGEIFAALNAVKKGLDELGGDDEKRERELDLLGYQIKEILDARLDQDELDELTTKRARMMNAERIVSGLKDAYQVLNEENGAGRAIGALGISARHDEEAAALLDRLKNAKIELDDICESIYAMIEDCGFDEREADRVERRLDEYKNIQRKYGKNLEAVGEFLLINKQRYELLKNASSTILELKEKRDKLICELENNAEILRRIREREAKEFSRAVESELGDVGMAACRFSVAFSKGKMGARGGDSVEFLLSANKGEDLKPLSKIISGGEMSRTSLALKVIAKRAERIGTLIFDEIDSGISGKIGQAIAQKLARLASDTQVLCVTHLPQMAAYADRQFLISKASDENKTRTFVKMLDYDGMINEISRLSGGVDGSDKGRQLAIEMKDGADKYKSKLS